MRFPLFLVVLTSFLAVVTSGLWNSKDTYIVVNCGTPAITEKKKLHQCGEKHKKIWKD
jgi:hypothetical protein